MLSLKAVCGNVSFAYRSKAVVSRGDDCKRGRRKNFSLGGALSRVGRAALPGTTDLYGIGHTEGAACTHAQLVSTVQIKEAKRRR
eukprot:1552640-Pleurochrysis_carterae.AAC.1